MGPIIDGLKLMVMGMGYVFVFLIIMIWCMKLLGKVLAPFANILDKPEAAPKRPAAANDNALRAAAAVAALRAHNGK